MRDERILGSREDRAGDSTKTGAHTPTLALVSGNTYEVIADGVVLYKIVAPLHVAKGVLAAFNSHEALRKALKAALPVVTVAREYKMHAETQYSDPAIKARILSIAADYQQLEATIIAALAATLEKP